MADKVILNLDVSISQMRIALIGNGYLLQEIEKKSDFEIIEIWQRKVRCLIIEDFYKGATK